jgi:NACalpha-BTF3-like transcription factor
MNTQEMKQAMNTLCQFSEKERNYFAYQARQDFLRQQGTILFEKDEALAQRDEALTERDVALAREQAALEREQAAQAEVERLKALLAQK